MDYTNHLEGLNGAQRAAVEHTEGPLLVLAGAGAGKTRVITHRIIHLIERGVAPDHILAVTFTNKAAREMRERVMERIASRAPSVHATLDRGETDRHPRSAVPQHGSLPLIATFHSLGVRILRERHELAGIRRHFTIYDRADSVRAVKKALEEAGYSPKQFEPRKILSMISRAKGDARSRLSFENGARSYPERVAAEIWERYDAHLKAENALDFDDLLFATLNLLKSHPGALAEYHNRFKYLHIDEYQDTNRVQYEIARLLAGEQANICAVGDLDQTVYSWRGADIRNILQFERHFKNAKTILLEENYRSTKTIIAASNDIIEKNRNRPPKTVFTNKEDGEPIALYAALTGTEEAAYVAGTAAGLIEDGASPSSIAVLFRTNFQSRALEEAFLESGVPYQVLGTRFFERKEVKDVLSYLRLATNPGSSADLARVANVPPRGIGKVTLLKLIEGRRDEITGAAKEKVAAFDELMTDIAEAARERPLADALRFIITRTGLEASLKKGGEEEQERLQNLGELVTLAAKYGELDTDEAVLRLLEDAALASDQDELKEKEEKDAVRLMTVHAAKGLEFPYVFVTGLEEGLFPHERLSDEKIDEEEERRLFYVALTRAERKVFLTFAHLRTIFGNQRVNIPSSFLADISDDLIEAINPGGEGEASGFERTILLD